MLWNQHAKRNLRQTCSSHHRKNSQVSVECPTQSCRKLSQTFGDKSCHSGMLDVFCSTDRENPSAVFMGSRWICLIWYMNLSQNFSQKNNLLSPFQKTTLAETVHYIPKVLRKGNPFHGPFCSTLIYVSCHTIGWMGFPYLWTAFCGRVFFFRSFQQPSRHSPSAKRLLEEFKMQTSTRLICHLPNIAGFWMLLMPGLCNPQAISLSATKVLQCPSTLQGWVLL